MRLDTSFYADDTPCFLREYKLPENWLTIVSKSLHVPQQIVALHDDGKSDEITVHLLATDEIEQKRMIELINSTSFLINMNKEISQIETITGFPEEKLKFTIKSHSEPVAHFLTGI